MRLGLLGVGRIGAFHADTLVGLPRVDSLVVADSLAGRARQVAAKLGVEAADSFQDVLRAGIDGVVIATATDAHAELLVAAVEAGLPVFCEKPISNGITSSVEVLSRVQDSRADVQIGYQRRFDPAFVAVKSAVENGELGWLHTVRSTTLDPAPPPPEYVSASGGLFRDCGVHDFDIIRWVSAREVVEVYATGSNRGAGYFADYGDIDTFAVTLSLDDGTLALVSNSRYNAAGYDVRLEVHGAQDSVAAGLEDQLPIRSLEPGASFPAGPAHPMFMQRFLTAYRAELKAFTEVVAGERPSPCTVADAIEAEWIAEACAVSWRAHRPVSLSEVRS